jgi:hypothetical protein
MIRFPDLGFKPLSARVADRNIWEKVVPVISHKRIGQERPERVIRSGAEDVVTQSTTASIGDPGRVIE